MITVTHCPPMPASGIASMNDGIRYPRTAQGGRVPSHVEVDCAHDDRRPIRCQYAKPRRARPYQRKAP